MSLLKYLCLLLLPTSFSPLTCLYTFSLYWPPLCLSFTFLLFISLSHAVLSLSNTHTHKQTHTHTGRESIGLYFPWYLQYIQLHWRQQCTGARHLLCRADMRRKTHTQSHTQTHTHTVGRKCNIHLPVNADIAYNLYTIIKSVIQEKVSEPHLREDS